MAVIAGQSSDVWLSGDNLRGATNVWISFAGSAIVSTGDTNHPGQAALRISVPKNSLLGIGALRVATTNGVSSFQMILIDELATVLKNGKNKTRESAQTLTAPIAIEGACDDLSSDFYKFTAKKGQQISVEIVAQRLGSKCDPVMRLFDAAGREWAYSDDSEVGADSKFTCKIPADGDYFLEVRDINYSGGSQFRYRLRLANAPLPKLPFLAGAIPPFSGSSAPVVADKEPNDVGDKAVGISVPSVLQGNFDRPGDRDFYVFEAKKNDRLVFRGHTRTIGSYCDLFMEIQKTNGAKIAETKIAGADDGAITNTFSEDGTFRLMIEELNRQGGPGLNYRVEVERLTPGFALTVDAEKINVSPGTNLEIKVTAARRDFKGPITLELDGAGKEFSVTNNVIPEGKTETQLTIQASENTVRGQMFSCRIVGIAKNGENDIVAMASTMTALRRNFPQMLFPPEALDGLIALGVGETVRLEPPPEKKKK